MRCGATGAAYEDGGHVDEQAFGEVFLAHRDAAFALALRLCGDRSQAEDAVAEAFAKVYVQWRRGRVDHVGAYLRRAVVNEVTSGWRRRAREVAWRQRRNGDGRGMQAFEDASADAVAFREALARLSPRQRSALTLRYWAGLPENEIAAAMGCSAGAVKSYLHRGRERLRELLGPDVMKGNLR